MATDPRSLYKTADPTGEAARAKRIAEQYGFEYVELDHFQSDHALFRDIPLDLMIRYQFLPERRDDGHIAIVVGDPTDVLKLDELELLLGAPLKVKVASPAAIREKLEKSESTQRVLDEATEGFRMQLVADNEEGEETLTIDSITNQEASPIIKLVDSIVFNAIQRRASDIHIETRDNEVVVKYRIDGVLYAARSEIQSPDDKIITIEDPVEYQLRGITQIPVNEKKGLTFARGLRAILRHDPDKIMVGEIRDEETAAIAVQSALTGHLVFTTVHANNVVDVLGRFLNMKVDLYNFVSALNCVLAQRLVRRVCPACRREVKYPDTFLIESGLNPAEYRNHLFAEGAGCLECNGSGFHGRSAIAELLDLSDRIRGMILDRRPASEIKKTAKEEGMTFLRESALKKVMEGRTTLREINKVTFVE